MVTTVIYIRSIYTFFCLGLKFNYFIPCIPRYEFRAEIFFTYLGW
nr:MAG TPA: hypothetical protein [Caudoviricetes sp.]